MNKPNFRKTTDKDVVTHIQVGKETTVNINVSLHPADVDRLHDVLDEFLPTCSNTNKIMEQIKQEYLEFASEGCALPATPEQLLCSYMADFFNENFEKITEDLDLTTFPSEKEAFVSELRNDVQSAAWALEELAHWGMDKPYLRELYVDIEGECDFKVLQIEGRYIKLTIDNEYNYHLNFIEPKTKTVVYFE